MKRIFGSIAGTLLLAALSALNLCAPCWAGPPGPPIPATPCGTPVLSALTVAAVAGYGYWKSRR